MKILVDTSIWSAAMRRSSATETAETHELRRLINGFRATLIGPIRQEILSGIPNPKQYETLRALMTAFVDEPITSADYECAAHFFNRCRAKGVQGSHVDFLICAVSVARSLPIFSIDKDFVGYAKYLPITLYKLKVA